MNPQEKDELMDLIRRVREEFGVAILQLVMAIWLVIEALLLSRVKPPTPFSW